MNDMQEDTLSQFTNRITFIKSHIYGVLYTTAQNYITRLNPLMPLQIPPIRNVQIALNNEFRTEFIRTMESVESSFLPEFSINKNTKSSFINDIHNIKSDFKSLYEEFSEYTDLIISNQEGANFISNIAKFYKDLLNKMIILDKEIRDRFA